eukprot:2210522-Rhodomonas_salina.3
MSCTEIACAGMWLRARYAMSGTDLAYGACRSRSNSSTKAHCGYALSQYRTLRSTCVGRLQVPDIARSKLVGSTGRRSRHSSLSTGQGLANA